MGWNGRGSATLQTTGPGNSEVSPRVRNVSLEMGRMYQNAWNANRDRGHTRWQTPLTGEDHGRTEEKREA